MYDISERKKHFWNIHFALSFPNEGVMSEDQNATSVWACDKRIPSNAVDTNTVLKDLLDYLRTNHWPERIIFGIHLAVEEALVNAIKHGNRLDETKTVKVVGRVEADELKLQITDEGQGFDPASVPDCTDPENLEVPSGRGLLLMRNFMQRVEYNALGNSVTLYQTRTPALVST